MMENERQDAWFKFRDGILGGVYGQWDGRDRMHFNNAFEMGYAAALDRTEWKRIETEDDLPKESGLVSQNRNPVRETPKITWYAVGKFNGYWLEEKVAYIPILIKPYTVPQPVTDECSECNGNGCLACEDDLNENEKELKFQQDFLTEHG